MPTKEHMDRVAVNLVRNDDMIILYRVESASSEGSMSDWIKQGQDASGHTEAKGRWFVSDPSMLDWYREDIGPNAVTVYVNVPAADLEKYRVSNCTEQFGHRTVMSFSRDPENEFFLPRGLASQSKDVTLDLQAELAVLLSERQHLTSLYYEAADNGQLDELMEMEAKVENRIDDHRGMTERILFGEILHGEPSPAPQPEKPSLAKSRDDGGLEM